MASVGRFGMVRVYFYLGESFIRGLLSLNIEDSRDNKSEELSENRYREGPGLFCKCQEN